MAVNAPAGIAGASTPLANDQANYVISGTFSAVGISAAGTFYGPFNVFIYNTITTTITTTAGSTSATVGSGTGIVAGQGLSATTLPPGTTVGAITGTTVTLHLPPNTTTAAILAGTGTALVVAATTTASSASVQLERSFDGGATWIIAGVGGAGQQAIFANPAGISVVAAEPERGMLYRLNCTAYVSGTLAYRMSATGAAAMAWAVSSAI